MVTPIRTAWTSGSVRVVVPARASSPRRLRVTAATAAAELVGTLQRLDDVRLVMDELAAAAIAAAAAAAPLDVRIDVTADAVAVRGRVEGSAHSPRLSSVGATLVTTLCHEHVLHADGDDVVFAFRMRPQPPT